MRILVVDQLRAAPGVLRGEGIGVADALRILQVRAGSEEVRRLVPCAGLVNEGIGVPGFLEAAHALVLKNRAVRLAIAQNRVTGLLGPAAFQAHIHGLGKIYRFRCAGATAAAPATPASTRAGGHADVAMAHFLRTAVGETLRFGAIGEDFPQVVRVVNDDAVVVLGPAGHTVGRLLAHGVVVLFVGETDFRILGDVAGGARFQIVDPEIAFLEIQGVAAAGTELHGRRDVFRHLGARAGVEVDLVDVREIAAEHGVVLIRHAIERQRARAVSRQPHVFLDVGGKRHQFVRGQVPRRRRIAVAVARRGQLLLADDVDVLPVPDFHGGGIFVGLLHLDFRGPPGDADVHGGTVLGPLRRA